MSTIKNLGDVLKEELRDLYSAENQILKALPKMIKEASSSELKQALTSHLKETEHQVARLEKIGKILHTKLSGKTCKGMKGLLDEGKEVLEMETRDDNLKDTLIIVAAQRVEHYEIAVYGTLCVIAEQLGLDEVVELLKETLEEEETADSRLSDISEEKILPQLDTEMEIPSESERSAFL